MRPLTFHHSQRKILKLGLTIIIALILLLNSNHERVPNLEHNAIGATKLIVSDGDSFSYWIGKQKHSVRLHGIDCPEKMQPFGKAAHWRSIELLEKLDFKVVPVSGKLDAYGRMIADVYLSDGQQLQKILLREGLAFNYQEFPSNDPEFKQLETKARKTRIGVWSLANPELPWNYRVSHKRSD